jgi:plasmid stabilization system protein ParE
MLVEFVDAFRALAQTPGMGHARQDLAEGRPVRFWPVREYFVIYRTKVRGIEIVTVVRASRDIPALLGRIESQ